MKEGFRKDASIYSGALTIDLSNRLVEGPNGKVTQLTSAELDMLLTLSADETRDRDQLAHLLETLKYGDDKGTIDRNHVSMNIRKLREKLEDDPNNPEIIQTRRGDGYILTDVDDIIR
jgi:DNA-binding response OmpR family regulator